MSTISSRVKHFQPLNIFTFEIEDEDQIREEQIERSRYQIEKGETAEMIREQNALCRFPFRGEVFGSYFTLKSKRTELV